MLLVNRDKMPIPSDLAQKKEQTKKKRINENIILRVFMIQMMMMIVMIMMMRIIVMTIRIELMRVARRVRMRNIGSSQMLVKM